MKFTLIIHKRQNHPVFKYNIYILFNNLRCFSFNCVYFLYRRYIFIYLPDESLNMYSLDNHK